MSIHYVKFSRKSQEAVTLAFLDTIWMLIENVSKFNAQKNMSPTIMDNAFKLAASVTNMTVEEFVFNVSQATNWVQMESVFKA